MRSERYEGLAAVSLMVAACIVWYFAYVKPNDEYRGEIAKCMRAAGDVSFESWQKCSKELDALR
jgi:hypothetical protein